MSLSQSLKQFLSYKAWANQLTFDALAILPEEELYKPRKTIFKNMVYTLNHVYVVDDIFKAHLTAASHLYTFRNTDTCPQLADLWQQQQTMDSWYLAYLASLSEADLQQPISFDFLDGGRGCMTVSDIILHIVNHGTYHRGLVSAMMQQISAMMPSNDYPVFLNKRPTTC